MSFRPLDIQSLLPESYEISRVRAADQQRGYNQQHQLFAQLAQQMNRDLRRVRDFSASHHTVLDNDSEGGGRDGREGEKRKKRKKRDRGYCGDGLQGPHIDIRV